MQPFAYLRITSHLSVAATCIRYCPSRLARPCSLRTFSSSHILRVRRKQRSLKKARITPDQKDALKDVNFFEEYDGPSPKRRRVSTPPWGIEDDEHPADIEEGIKNLEEEIQTFKMDEEMPYDLARKIFTNEQIERASSITAEDLEGLRIDPPRIESTRNLPRQSQVLLDRLNTALAEAAEDPELDEKRRQLWRWFERCKFNVPGLLEMVPKGVWDIIWATQSNEDLSNEDRLAHLVVLAQDMQSVGWKLTEDQRRARVEGLFVNGQESKALKEWEADAADAERQSVENLELGIRMYAFHGNTPKAVELLETLKTTNADWSPRIMVPIISACAGGTETQDLDQAWHLYQQFREKLGKNISAEDYDEVCLAFLSANQKEYALAAFRDMMLSGNTLDRDQSSINIMGHVGRMIGQTHSAKEANSNSLDALTYLPRKFQNKYFYASWLKRLIGGGEVNAAAQVVELMYERGVPPDAKHMNGLIGAWLRYGDEISTKNAETISWAMIQKRIDFAQRRRSVQEGRNSKKTTIFQTEDGTFVPPFVERPVPAATMETFSILVAHYIGQAKFQHVRHLRNLLPEAEIPMNAFFMNHLLLAEIANHGWRSAWVRFEVMSRTVTPDARTFTALWENMKLYIDSGEVDDEGSGHPSPRALFRQMMEWFSGLRGQQRTEALEDMDSDAYHDILRCFFLSKDVIGAFTAMKALKELFGIYPEPRSIRMFAMQIARLNKGKQKRDFKAPRVKEEHRRSQAKALEVLDLITSDRRERLLKAGFTLETLDAKQQAEENHRAVLSLLYSVAKQSYSEANFDFQESVNDSCSQMGVAAFDVDAATALSV